MVIDKVKISALERMMDKASGGGRLAWIRPQDVSYDASMAKRKAKARYESDPPGASDELEVPEDRVITNYLCECLDRRLFLRSKGEVLPPELDISFDLYVDAILFLIYEFEVPDAVNALGATCYHNDEFFAAGLANATLEELKTRYEHAPNRRVSDLLRTLLLELFHVGYPWVSSPRYEKEIGPSGVGFLKSLLQVEPLASREFAHI